MHKSSVYLEWYTEVPLEFKELGILKSVSESELWLDYSVEE
jgi:hypothetical protein